MGKGRGGGRGMGGHGGGHGGGKYSPVKCFGNIFISFVGAGVLGLPYAFSMAGVLESCVILAFAGMVCTKAMLMLVECKDHLIARGYRPAENRGPTTPRKSRPADDKIELDRLDGGPGATELLLDGHDAESGNGNGVVNGHGNGHASAKGVGSGAAAVAGGGGNDEVMLDYGDLAQEAAGDRGWWLAQASIVMSQVGFCCAYLIFITHNVSSLLKTVTPNEVLMMVLVPEVLLVNIRDLSRLGIFSLLADAANIFAYCVVFSFDFAKVEETGLHGRMEKVDGFPFFLGVAIYCYEGAGMIITLESSVPKEHRKDFPRIFRSAIFVITMLYMFFGASGYISYGNETEKIITLNMPQGPFPSLVKACLSFSLFFTYPVMMFPVSALLDKLIASAVDPSAPMDPSSSSFFRGTAMRAGLVALSGVVVVAIPDFAAIMGLIGSTCCMLLALILPGYFHLKIFGSHLSDKERCFDYFLILLGIFGFILGTRDAIERIMSSSDGPSEEVL